MLEVKNIKKAFGKTQSRRPSGLRKTRPDNNSLAHRTTWLRSDFVLGRVEKKLSYFRS